MRRGLLALMVVSLFVSCGGASYPDRISFEGIDAVLGRGSDHCGWDDTWMIFIISEELAGPTSNPGQHMFVRNPGAVPEYLYEVDADLNRSQPSDAALLGTARGGYELWFAVSDPDYVYVVSGDRTEAWARAVEWGLCE